MQMFLSKGATLMKGVLLRIIDFSCGFQSCLKYEIFFEVSTTLNIILLTVIHQSYQRPTYYQFQIFTLT